MPEPDPTAELLAQVAGEHREDSSYPDTCVCEVSIADDVEPEGHYLRHLAEVQAAALRAAGRVVDGAAEVEWAVIDRGRTIHIEGATCPADALAGAHGHGATQVGVARRTVTRTPWQPLEGDRS